MVVMESRGNGGVEEEEVFGGGGGRLDGEALIVAGVESADDDVVDLSHVVGGPDRGMFVGDFMGESSIKVKGGDEGVMVVCKFRCWNQGVY